MRLPFALKKPSLKLIVILVIVIIVMASVGVAIYFFAVLKTVKLAPSNGITITLTRQSDNVEITKTDEAKVIKVRSGSYGVNYSAGEDYQAINQTIVINGPTTISPPQLNYSISKLATMLPDEKSEIQAALAATITDIGSYYVGGEGLFARGDCYGVMLVPNTWFDPSSPVDALDRAINPNNTLDIVRVIAKKDGEQWQVVAGPSLIFYLDDYPNIPEEVVRAVNALSIAQ